MTSSSVTRLPDGSGRHAPECECPRCAGFAFGNSLSVVHGANSSVAKLLPEAEPLAAELEPLVPAFAASDRPLVLLLALTLRRIARAEAYLSASEEAADADRAEKLARELRGWVNSSARIMDSLGMSPTARARLGLDIARGASALEEYVEREYVDGERRLDERIEVEDVVEVEDVGLVTTPGSGSTGTGTARNETPSEGVAQVESYPDPQEAVGREDDEVDAELVDAIADVNVEGGS